MICGSVMIGRDMLVGEVEVKSWLDLEKYPLIP
jgi:hypothetical protein